MKKSLSKEQIEILKNKGTERAFTGKLLYNKKDGIYKCVGCGNNLFSSDEKYDSGSGWPSFSKAIDGAIGTRIDGKFFMIRTECHCSNCGSHLGHIFDDGPQPTGKRHCINGISLVFRRT